MGEIFGLALALVVVTVVGIGFALLGGARHSADPRLCAGCGAFSDRCCSASPGLLARAHPEKIMGILQGEALMNDASGPVSLKFAVAVAMGT